MESKTTPLKEHQRNIPGRGVYDTRNRVNSLTGKEWRFSSKSVIPKAYPPDFSHALRSEHGGQKPPILCKELIETFSKEKNLVFDPLAGVGGSLIGASLCNRRAIGIEINERWKEIYLQVCKENQVAPQDFYVGDCLKITDQVIEDNSVDFILTDVPYWNMDKLEKTRGTFSKAGVELTPDKKKKLDTKLSQFNTNPLLSKEEWKTFMREVFSLCYSKLNETNYLAVFIGDLYRTSVKNVNGKNRRVGEYHQLSKDLADVIKNIPGFYLKAERIWYDVSKKLGIYGYPFDYVPSQVHQSILVFKKEY